jgi:hypothetical protein
MNESLLVPVAEVRFTQQQTPPGSVQLAPYFVASEKLALHLTNQGVIATHLASDLSVLYPMHLITRVTYA